MISTTLFAAAALCALHGEVTAGWALFIAAAVCFVIGTLLNIAAAVL